MEKSTIERGSYSSLCRIKYWIREIRCSVESEVNLEPDCFSGRKIGNRGWSNNATWIFFSAHWWRYWIKGGGKGIGYLPGSISKSIRKSEMEAQTARLTNEAKRVRGGVGTVPLVTTSCQLRTICDHLWSPPSLPRRRNMVWTVLKS